MVAVCSEGVGLDNLVMCNVSRPAGWLAGWRNPPPPVHAARPHLSEESKSPIIQCSNGQTKKDQERALEIGHAYTALVVTRALYILEYIKYGIPPGHETRERDTVCRWIDG